MYPVFVAVNEQRVSGEAIKAGHCREDYLRFLDAPPGNPVLALEANGHRDFLVDESLRTGSRRPCSNGLSPPGRSA